MARKYESVGRVVPPGTPAGQGVSQEAAKALGMPPGTPVGVSMIDAHAGVPGVGVGGAGDLVVVAWPGLMV